MILGDPGQVVELPGGEGQQAVGLDHLAEILHKSVQDHFTPLFPSATRLYHSANKAKGGSFKGSFKAYAAEQGRPRAYTVNVEGVLVDGVGHGVATMRKPTCTFPVTIE